MKIFIMSTVNDKFEDDKRENNRKGCVIKMTWVNNEICLNVLLELNWSNVNSIYVGVNEEREKVQAWKILHKN